MHILVCGGAGYIGSHAALALQRAGHRVTVLDNLSTGHAEAVRWGPLVQADLLNPESLDAAFTAEPVDAVMHFCALSLVGHSVREPYDYYRNNVTGSLNLLQAMRRHHVNQLVFSSTAAVFGHPQSALIDEQHPTQPINPYGASKWMVERILQDAAAAYGLNSVALRYFNAAGAAPDEGIGESHQPETHLIPNVLRGLLGTGPQLKVFGDDYPTRDGTCIRDYVHVLDLADAHLNALTYLASNPGHHVFNLGNGEGFSVREVIAAAERVSGQAVPFAMESRREGDPAVLVASSERARKELAWAPSRASLDQIIGDAWAWHRAQPF